MSKIGIRPMVSEDRAAFVELTALRPGFDRARAERRTDVIWHIAFQNPTSDGGPTYFVATDGARLLCHMGRIPTWFFVEGRRHLASFAHDLFAHPELQSNGTGFFTTMKLYKCVEDACPSFCGLLWTNEINVKLQQARKYDQLWVQRRVRPLGADREIDAHLAPLPGALRGALRRTTRAAVRVADRALRSVRRAERTERVLEADERFDALADVAGPRLGTAPIKDRAYVRWKYFAWPYLRTAVYVVPDGKDRIRGFVVLREPDSEAEAGRILDLVADPDDGGALASLIARAIAHYHAVRAPRVECVATFPPMVRALEEFFFVERPPRMPLFFLNGHKYENPSHLRSVETWSHAFGDSEGGEVP